MKALMADFIEIQKALTIIAIVVFGAVVHATVQLKIARDTNTTFSWKDFVILLPICMFSGWIFALIATWILPNGSQSFVSLCAGLGAFLGVTGLNKIGNAFLDILVNQLTNRKK